ncbi:MAG: right-handed parallel beta-helix repeat-containing protein [Lentisphaerae bacterium]|nr:right-handed parallel beta-helix repeat-containing protein [Lentisphaerota bacterium]
MMVRRMGGLAVGVAWAAVAGAAEIHVAIDGNDAWSGATARSVAGRTNGPVASLARARDAARAMRASGSAPGAVTVLVGPGTFALPATLTLGPADSGTPVAPLTIRGAGGGRTILTGGRPVTNFIERAGGVLEADLAAAGLKGARFRQLVFGGSRMPLARHPNFDPSNPYGGGWAYADGERIPMYKDIPGESRRTLRMKEADARPWSAPADGEVWVFPRYNWWNNIIRIASVDAASRTVTLKSDCSYPIRPGDRYFVQGMREDLDAPGEWWLDVTNSVLRFLPPEPLRGRPVHAPALRTLVELAPGASSIRMERLVLECCEGTAVVMRETTNCVLAASEIRTVGDYNGSGVSIAGGLSNAVFGCDIHHTGSHGVSISGGDRVTLAAAANSVENCYIHHVGTWHGQGVGVSLVGVGNRAAHNLIHDGPRMGIMFSGNNLVIEFNHIRHMNLETSDTGGTYTGGRDWISSRGTVLRHNFIHDILGYGEENGRWVSPYYAWGIYEDDNAGGVDLIGNIVARCPRAAIHLHNGRDTLIANNILVDCGLAMVEYNGWTSKHSYWTNHLGSMVKGYESVAGSPAWRGMRNMDLHPTNAVQPDGTIMTGNEFVRNIVAWTGTNTALFRFRSLPLHAYRSDSNLIWHAGLPIKTGFQRPGMDEWEAWKALGFDSNSIVADPRFRDPAKDDYRTGSFSPARTIGFEPIPVERIGPYRAPLRASWPIVEAEGAREHPPGGEPAGGSTRS